MKKHLSVLILICLLLTLCACGSEPRVIGAWRTDASILGYAAQTDEPYEITISLGYENAGQESHDIPDDNRNLPFNYTYEDDILTVWQVTNVFTYRVNLTEDTMELTPEGGSSITLTRISDRPLGVQ